MRKRWLYAAGLALLALCIGLVFYQGSFGFGELGPADPQQTLILWAVSTLIFLLMVTLAFILGRTGIKLYVERRSNREGSLIKTKLLIGALGLSFMPVLFLVLFSIQVLNVNLVRWFTRPAEGMRLNLIEIAKTLEAEVMAKATVQAELLAQLRETQSLLAGERASSSFLETFCRRQGIAAVEIRSQDGSVTGSWGATPLLERHGKDVAVARLDMSRTPGGRAEVAVAVRAPLDVAEKQREIERHTLAYDQLAANRKEIRKIYLMFLALITLFILFVATWLALFLAKQISAPIAALIHAAGEVRQGNLAHRVQTHAIDELAGLVRGFNEMTAALETSGRELDARRRFTEAILESIPTGVISISADGTIKRVNRALSRIFPEDQVRRASNLDQLLSRDDMAEIRYLIKRARRTGAVTRQVELSTGTGRIQLAVTVSSLEDAPTTGYVVILEDTTELLRAQKAAAWHEVARRVAHEIKNPLTPISLSAERISRLLDRLRLEGDSARIVREAALLIMKEVESVKTLVDEFSQLARFPAAQLVRADLNEVVLSALAVFEGRLDDILVVTELSRGLPPVMVDREQFKRVIVNLVDNAAEAMHESLIKQLFVATRAVSSDSIEVTVADTGCGVSADDKEKLFLPYFSTKGRGTGLGLAIVNHILADHQAQIRVEDNVPAGARFTIEIPAAQDAGEEPRGTDWTRPAAGVRA